jgi:transcriptional regulator with XRE-family HTH domain
MVTNPSNDFAVSVNDARYRFGHSACVDVENEEKAAIKARIRERMGTLGIKQGELARRMGVSPAEMSRWINEGEGSRRIDLRRLRQFASALDCSWKNLIDAVLVPVRGYVGAGEQVHNFEGPIGYTEAPDGAERTEAFVVQGDSMLPKYEPGTKLYIYPSDTVTDDCIGRTCIVQVKDGPTLVKKLKHGSKPGLFRLLSLRAPEIEDVEILWAARVRWFEEP